MGSLETSRESDETRRSERAADALHDNARRPALSGGVARSVQLLGLQRSAGNRVVARLVSGSGVTGGEHSVEAGAHSLTPAVETALAGGNELSGGTSLAGGPTLPAPGSDKGGFAIPDDVGREIDATRGGGAKLPQPERSRLGAAFGVDVDTIRVHNDARADSLASRLDARAFTSGADIFMRAGEGRDVLSHEVAHAIRGDAPGGSSQVARLTDEQRTNLLGRAAALDYNLLTDLATRAPMVGLLSALKPVAPEGGDPTDAEMERESLKQLLLVSGASTDAIEPLANSAVASGDPTALRRLLRKSTRSTGTIMKLVSDCRNLLNDYFRFEQARGGEANTDELKAIAKGADTRGEFAGQLQHQETYRKFLFFKKTRTVTHTLEDVMAKAKLVGQIDLRHYNSPESMPRSKPEEPVVRRARVGVAGGGPVGLMAALEARMGGAEVILFEGRTDEYTRRQVLALDESTKQKFLKFGIKRELLDDPSRKGSPTNVAVKYIEKALRDRALELGIEIRTGWYLATASEGEGTTKATFLNGKAGLKSKMVVEELDLLVVAAGAGVAKQNKYTGVTLGDELGFKYEVKQARDYAVVGIFNPTEQGDIMRRGANNDEKRRWAYRFNTPKVTYVLQQIPAELYKEFTDKNGGQQKMEAFIKNIAKVHYEMADGELAKDVNSKGQRSPNVGVFPIEIQQAKTFVNQSLRTLLIGDSAATPHPHTGSGLNTGVRELDALADVVESVRAELIIRSQGGSKGSDKDQDSEEPTQVKSALERYNTEIKSLTDGMVAKALKTLAGEHLKYLQDSVKGLRANYGSLLASDFALGGRVDRIDEAVKKITAKDGGWGSEDQLDALLEYQSELARIRSQLESLVPQGGEEK